jgi:hypothetical protein
MISIVPIVFVMKTTIAPFNFFTSLFIEEPSHRAFTWLGITGVLIPIFLLSHVHQFLWGERNLKFPKWIPSLRSLGEGAYSWLVLFLCFAMSFSYAVNLQPNSYQQVEEQIEQEAKTFFFSFMLISAYAYHLKSLIGAKFQAKRSP